MTGRVPSGDSGPLPGLVRIGAQMLPLGICSGLLSALAAVLFILIRGTQYTAQGRFVPAGGESDLNLSAVGGALGSLAGQLGLGASSARSPDFYVALVTSRPILEQLAVAHIPASVALEAGADSRDTTLQGIIVGDEDEPAGRRLDETVKQLSEDWISAESDPTTGLVTVRVTAPGRGLSLLVLRQLLGQVNRFDIAVRKVSAREERHYLEERADTTGAQLRAAEDALRAFYERNRSYQSSPVLLFEETRLRRQVDIAQQVYLAVLPQLELARAREVRETPVFTIIEDPWALYRHDRRHLAAISLFVFLVGLTGVTVLVALLEGWTRVAAGVGLSPAGADRLHGVLVRWNAGLGRFGRR